MTWPPPKMTPAKVKFARQMFDTRVQTVGPLGGCSNGSAARIDCHSEMTNAA